MDRLPVAESGRPMVGVVALVASLVGGLRPVRLVCALLGLGWLLVVAAYFVLFWSAGGTVPLFAGFIPALFTERPRGLADFLAGTVVL